ncbi:MAG: hypothetical protein Q9214_002783 [Letrouitia sp. 1 TL-2023]
MPCFKGLAVSIHAPHALPEYSIQKQSRSSRISAYIPVPEPKVPQNSATKVQEQATFAISITLLTPGLEVPYSKPEPTSENPYPRARIVSGLPSVTGERGRYIGIITPYVPLTTSPNETIAAYIYFDGRAKEEVATLLRRGEETWVNSRWVSVPESEGGGLAEREFLFREVGLERWLDGLDLEGKDVEAKIEKRRQKLDRSRRRKQIKSESDNEADISLWGGTSRSSKGVLRYGADIQSPVEDMSDEDELFLSGSESDDDPIPETAGQIKIALFRVIASGEIKRGEYSPQFGAHDDDDEVVGNHNALSNGKSEESIEHTTSFAKPKTLDPKTISTQTVQGIDGPDRPFAVFTFLYRGERQLRKMGILSPSKIQAQSTTTAKRRSTQADFADLKPLKPGGTVGFSTFRDPTGHSTYSGGPRGRNSSEMDSDEDDDFGRKTPEKGDDVEPKEPGNNFLSPEDARRQDEVAEGVQKIRLKRQHSAEPLNAGSPATRKSPASNSPTAGSTPSDAPNLATTPPALLPSMAFDLGSSKALDSGPVGSPLKRARASLSGLDEETMGKRLGLGFSGTVADAIAQAAKQGQDDSNVEKAPANEQEEL